jgi:hypothetical protein
MEVQNGREEDCSGWTEWAVLSANVVKAVDFDSAVEGLLGVQHSTKKPAGEKATGKRKN